MRLTSAGALYVVSSTDGSLQIYYDIVAVLFAVGIPQRRQASFVPLTCDESGLSELAVAVKAEQGCTVLSTKTSLRSCLALQTSSYGLRDGRQRLNTKTNAAQY